MRRHWDEVYGSKGPTEVSWYQPDAVLSLRLVEEFAPDRSAAIIDVGGGASTFVDGLLDAGYSSVTVLDISEQALSQARERLGERASSVTWLVEDVLATDLPQDAYDLWHDRAVFHFLTDDADRKRYVTQVRRSVRVGGHVAVATFASDGPTHCSGLEVVRYSAEDLHAVFGSDFRLLQAEREEHVTPWGATQPFTYCMCRLSA